MRTVTKYYTWLTTVIVFFTVGIFAQTEESDLFERTELETRANLYSEMRARLVAALPALPEKATPEQIDAHRKALLKAVREERKDAKQGDIITPNARAALTNIINRNYQGQDLVELRKVIIEAENKSVPVKVNAEYPASQEKLEMPPKLLLALPELPEILQYRFVGKDMLIVDRESNLIIDFAPDVVPI